MRRSEVKKGQRVHAVPVDRAASVVVADGFDLVGGVRAIVDSPLVLLVPIVAGVALGTAVAFVIFGLSQPNQDG